MHHRREFLQTAAAVSLLGVIPRAASGQDKSMIVHRRTPMNAEPRPPALQEFITKQADLYIRNHGNVPKLDAETYRIKVGSAEFDLAAIKAFPHRTVTAVMQCAGNRRSDMGEHRSVSGDAWRVGAIGNARWLGVSLSDVLKKAGIGNKPHLAISCHDDCEENREKFKYGVSIPMAKAMDPDTILAWDMNGETLTAEHGFPLRLVVPGFAGARSPKWIAAVAEQDNQSDNYIQQKAYRMFPPSVIKEKADWSKAPVINEMPLNSAVLSPLESATVPAGKLTVQGFAICTQSSVARVEVSGDGGKCWVRGELQKEGDSKWSWVHWRAELDLKPGGRQIVVRAFDSQGRGQPASTAPIYNFPGYLMTAWHRVNVQVKGAA